MYIQIGYKEIKIHFNEFILHEFIKEVEGTCKWLAIQKQIKFTIVRKKTLPKAVIGDRSRLMQITLNVLTKAMEFTDIGSVIELIVKQTKERKVSFAVRSYGPTMQKKLEQYISNSPRKKSTFTQSLAPSETDAIQNLDALSLEICQLICKQMGTNILVKISQVYSQFKFVLQNSFTSPMWTSRKKIQEKSRRNSSNQDRKDRTEITELGVNKVPEGKVEEAKVLMNRTSYLSKITAKMPSVKSQFSQKHEEQDDYQDLEIPAECGELERISLPESSFNNLTHHAPGFTRSISQKEQPEVLLNPFSLSRYKSQEPNTVRTPLRPRPKKKRRGTFATKIKGLKACRAGAVDDVEKCQVLITDDDTFNRNVLKKLLKNRGLNGLEACDGSEAVNIIDKHLGAGQLSDLLLVFMDLQMPVMNGIEAVSKIKSLCAERRVPAPLLIGLSCSTVEDDRMRFMRAGLDEFVSKPITKKKLDYILNKYL